jgi:hypothetical protein
VLHAELKPFDTVEESGPAGTSYAFPMMNKYDAGAEPVLAIAAFICAPSSLRRSLVAESE